MTSITTDNPDSTDELQPTWWTDDYEEIQNAWTEFITIRGEV